MTVGDIAHIAHEAIRVYCATSGEPVLSPWVDANDSERQMVIASVEYALSVPTAEPAAMHEIWASSMTDSGWVFGQQIDLAGKTHPALEPYETWSEEQRTKDVIFFALVNALRPSLPNA